MHRADQLRFTMSTLFVNQISQMREWNFWLNRIKLDSRHIRRLGTRHLEVQNVPRWGTAWDSVAILISMLFHLINDAVMIMRHSA